MREVLHERFAAAAGRWPERVALVDDRSQLSFRELDALSDRLAARLARDGSVEPGTLVALRSEPEIPACVAILGILKAGAAWLPLDPGDPRAPEIVERAGPVLLLGEPLERGPAAWPLEPLVDGAEIDGVAPLPPVARSPDSLAYLPFTSGSTGRPKGVLNSHRACLEHARSFVEAYPLAKDDRWCLKAALSFVDSIYELFGGLLDGVTVVVAGGEIRRDPEQLLALLGRHRVTRLIVVPALLDAILDVARSGELRQLAVRLWAVSGDRFHPSLVGRFLESGARGRLVNLYGASEAPGTIAPLDAVPDEPVPVGWAVPGATVTVQDRLLRPVPVGARGDVWLGGPGLAQGYLGAPAKAAETFVPDPNAAVPGGRMYATGDIGVRLADGAVAVIGRRDRQVKIRGHRVELGEVESAFIDHPAVRQAVAVKAEGAAADALVVWCRAVPGAAAPEEAELHAHARERLPLYMRPKTVRVVDEFPVSPHGKVDRRLIARDGAAVATSSAAQDGTGIEPAILEAWRELLPAPVALDDDVFERGADSLLAARLVGRLRRAGIELTVRDVFDARTTRELAPRARAGAARPPIGPDPAPDEPAPLSYPQRSFWFMEQLAKGDPAHAIHRAFRLRGPLDVSALRRAVERVVEQHDALRNAFELRDEGPVQALGPLVPSNVWCDDVAPAEPFDLERGAVVRFALTPLGTGEHLFEVALHHISGDDWSLELLFREISAHYTAVRGTGPEPRPPVASYRAFARWQEDIVVSGALDDQLAYWRRRLADAPQEPIFPLPPGSPRLRIPVTEAARLLSEETARGLEDVARRAGATLQMTILAAYAVAIARWAGSEAVAVGIPVSGRIPETERTIGCFANTVAFHTEVREGEPFEDLLARVRDTALDDFANGEVPFEKVVEALAFRQRRRERSPLYQAMFGFQPWPDDEDLVLEGIDVESVRVPAIGTQIDLDLAAVRLRDGLDVVLGGNATLFSAERIEEMVGELAELLERVSVPAQRLSGVA